MMYTITKQSKERLTPAVLNPSPIRVYAKRLLQSTLWCISAALASTSYATNLMDVYNAATENDAVVGAARAGYAATQQSVPQARSALLPNLSASANTSWTEREFPGSVDGSPNNFGNQVPDQNFNEHGWNAQLRAPILNMGSWFGVGTAKANVSAAQFDLARTEQELVVRVVQAYLDVLRAQDLVDTSRAEEAAVKRQLEQVQQRFDVGLVAITDVLESQAVYDASRGSPHSSRWRP